MQVKFRVTRKRVALAVAASALVAAGAAIGVTSNAYTDANGVYHGCVAKDGLLRVLGNGQNCKTNEGAIDWNQVGPQGSQGPQGAQGQQGMPGPQGAPGPSDIYLVRRPFFRLTVWGNNFPPPLHDVEVASLVLPPGDYEVVAQHTPGYASVSTGEVACDLRVDGLVDQHFYRERTNDVEVPSGEFGQRVTAYVSLAAPGTARILCFGGRLLSDPNHSPSNGRRLTVDNARIAATRVGQLHATKLPDFDQG